MCGLFGVLAYKNDVSVEVINKLVSTLAKASEVRGTDAGGVSFIDNSGAIKLLRNEGGVTSNGVLTEPILSHSVMGHTRMTTQGKANLPFNNHPFPSTMGRYCMAHNGVLSNDVALAKEYALQDTKVQTDSYIVVRLIDKLHNGVINLATLKDVAEKLSGQFNLTFQTDDGIWIVKHNNPLTILQIKELGCYVYASTDDILLSALKSYYGTSLMAYLMGRSGKQYGKIIPIESGTILHIKQDGTLEKGTFTPKVVTYVSTSMYDYDDYDYRAFNKSYDTPTGSTKSLNDGYWYKGQFIPYSDSWKKWNADKEKKTAKALGYTPVLTDRERLATLENASEEGTDWLTEGCVLALNCNGDEEVFPLKTIDKAPHERVYSYQIGRFIDMVDIEFMHEVKATDLQLPYSVDDFQGELDKSNYSQIVKELHGEKKVFANIWGIISGNADELALLPTTSDSGKKEIADLLKSTFLLYMTAFDKFNMPTKTMTKDELSKLDLMIGQRPLMAYVYMQAQLSQFAFFSGEGA